MDRPAGPGRQLVESFYVAELFQPLLRRCHCTARAVIGREICDTDGQFASAVSRGFSPRLDRDFRDRTRCLRAAGFLSGPLHGPQKRAESR